MTAAPRLVAAALVACALAGQARGAERGRREDGAAAARKQARRANDLAATGKCRQAIPLFSKAFEVLKDPALLFNRAECHRRLGNDDEALTDYVQFLVELPTAPNRELVEQRINAIGAGGDASRPPAQGAPSDGSSSPAPSTPATAGSEG